MAVTENSYTGNGSTTNYAFTFPYLKSTDVEVQVDAAVTTAWTFANATTVQFNTAPANGAKIKILRQTNVDNLTATFYAGSAIKSEDLNDNYTQNLYVTQEVKNRAFQSTGGTLTGDLTMGEDTTIVFEGATDDAHETTLAVADPTADRTITLPNVTGTVVTTGDTGTVTSAMIADATIVAGDIAADTITAGKIAANAVGSSELADNAVDTAAIAADAVTSAKIADDSIDSEHYVDGSVDLAHLSANSVDSSKIVDGSIVAGDIANATITGAKLANDTVTATQIAANAITNSELADDAVSEAKIQDNSIGSGEIKDNAVTLAKMADSSVGTSELVNDAVTTVKIAADAVTGAKIADDAIDSEHYTDGSIDLAHMSANSVDSDQYVDGSIDRVHLAADIVDGSKIADDAIGAEHIQANAVGTGEIADAELVTLAGMQSGTASILASGTALTATTTELNLLDGKSFSTSVSGSSTDVQIPSAKAVNDQIVAIVQDIGGFYPIADELKFPNTNPDPNDDAGTIVSIADAGGIVVNGSGVSTTGRTLGGSTVTINGIDSSLHNTTIAAGKGMLVQTTSTLNTYDYHRLIIDEAGVASAQTLVTDFNQRYQVAGSTPSNQPDGTALAEGDLWFDTGSNKMKVYDGSNYAEVTSVGDYKLLTVVNDGQTSGSPTYNGSIVSYDLRDGGSAASVTAPGQLLVSLNGVLQKPNSGSYSSSEEGFYLEGSNGIKFCTAPPSGSSVFVTLIGSATTINTPGSNSVATASIQNGAVTAAKLATMDDHVEWADNKYAKFGDSGDLCVYHNVNSFIKDNGAGSLILDTNGLGVKFTKSGLSETMAYFITDGACELYHDNVKKFETVTGGATITGVCTATSFAGDGSSLTGVDSSKADGCIWENDQTISNDYTIASGKGAHSVGPITVNATVTVNGNWVVS